MTESVLALYGSGRGPNVPLRGGKPTAKIVGRLISGEVEYHVNTKNDGVQVMRFNYAGEFDLPAGDSLHVEYNSGNAGVLCFVRM